MEGAFNQLKFRCKWLATHIRFWIWSATHAPEGINYLNQNSQFSEVELIFVRPYSSFISGGLGIYFCLSLQVYRKPIYYYPADLARAFCRQHGIEFDTFFTDDNF